MISHATTSHRRRAGAWTAVAAEPTLSECLTDDLLGKARVQLAPRKIEEKLSKEYFLEASPLVRAMNLSFDEKSLHDLDRKEGRYSGVDDVELGHSNEQIREDNAKLEASRSSEKRPKPKLQAAEGKK